MPKKVDEWDTSLAECSIQTSQEQKALIVLAQII